MKYNVIDTHLDGILDAGEDNIIILLFISV